MTEEEVRMRNLLRERHTSIVIDALERMIEENG